MKPLLILLAGLNLLATGSSLATDALPPASGWAFEHREGGLALQLDGQPVGEFVYRDAKVLRPFFANLRTPGGDAVTRNHPPIAGTDATDHDTMHPGVWLAFGDINGQDFWRNQGRIEHVRFIEPPQAEKYRLRFATECRLLAADGVTLGSLSNRFTLIALTNAWLLAWEADFHAGDADLVFGDQEEMGFGARVATSITEKNGGVITSSSGLNTAKRTWGQPAEWCDYSGTVNGQRAGITLMTDPANFRPSWWHNRDYGLMVANPFGRKAMNQGDPSRVVVKQGQRLSLRFGAYLHAAAAAPDSDIVAGYRRFLVDNAAAPRHAPDTSGIPEPPSEATDFAAPRFATLAALAGGEVHRTEANVPIEISFTAVQRHREPFLQVTMDVVFTDPAGVPRTVPAFWAGGNQWKVRYSSPLTGTHRYRTQCSETGDAGLHGIEGRVEVVPYTGDNPLYRHGWLRIARDQRHFEHADGTPFLWLGDTWWKCLSRRMTWEGFQELTADRKAKGFNAVQIVCGPYPDENVMEARWENEGGMPYTKLDFSVVNPRYFEFADRRIRHLVEAGIVPVMVGGWGRPQGGGRSTLHQVGLDGFKRHWRNLVARYGAYPTVWIVGGEARDDYGPWAELAKYVRAIDPYRHPLGYHSPAHPREAIQDNAVFDFDMVAIGHEGLTTAAESLKLMKSCQSQTPARPVLCGEACYEGHMQTNFQDIQRHLFWTFMLSGAAGHTYGAAGVWQASVEGDPGIDPVYDWTTWKEGMNFPGSTQLGLGKRFLEQYPWARFEAHPEWADEGCFAAGIPGEVRFIYLPKRNIYDWSGPLVKNLEPHIDWHAFYFDPATGRRFDRGILEAKVQPGDPAARPMEFRGDVPSPQDWILVLENTQTRKSREP